MMKMIIDTKRIEQALLNKDKSAVDIAKRFGLTKRMVGGYRRGEYSIYRMSLERAMHIIDILDNEEIGTERYVNEATEGTKLVLQLEDSALYQSKQRPNDFVRIYRDSYTKPQHYTLKDSQVNTVVFLIKGIHEASNRGKDTSNMYDVLKRDYFN